MASITLALFPYISATDDVLRVEQYASQHGPQQGAAGHSGDLVRLFETADHSLVARSCQIALTFFFLELVVVLARWSTSRITPLTAGRSPPLVVGA